MADRPSMHEALKKIVVPDLRKRGFQGTYPHFRRILHAQTDLLSFQFDWNGLDLFVIHIAQVAGSGSHKPQFADDAIPMKKLKAFQASGPSVRLQPKLTTDGWFNYEDEQYDKMALSVLPFIERAEQWFADTSSDEGVVRISYGVEQAHRKILPPNSL